ncbi:chemotaxis protein CheW [Alkalihalobacterium chitinilyticum]|uniref:Chemotaxis protein CheW n=1 Tax=Alkalihalobacterium chitinilyticum TaxID=2980103 RepID=A0ABT5VJA5_9BACI|nr:chemotaxis protein CheW [Alkalihalobacterium chitinilyticum]MDE5415537.1 chemotaxis protein CheW [Alkalihalobacterium chitinilyticum]
MSVTATRNQYVVFTINQQLFSLPINEVVEILRPQTVTQIPGIKSHIQGVINLRGKIIPVVKMHGQLNSDAKPNKKNRIVIVQGDSENIGVTVDEVKMVTYVEQENIEPPPGTKVDEDFFHGFVKLDGQVIGILNLEKVLYPTE